VDAVADARAVDRLRQQAEAAAAVQAEATAEAVRVATKAEPVVTNGAQRTTAEKARTARTAATQRDARSAKAIVASLRRRSCVGNAVRAAKACKCIVGVVAPKDDFGAAGGVQAVVDLMRAHPESKDVQRHACAALSHLAKDHAGNRALGAAAGALPAVVAAMKAHLWSKDVLWNGCGALLYLVTDHAGNRAMAREQGGVEAVAAFVRCGVGDGSCARRVLKVLDPGHSLLRSVQNEQRVAVRQAEAVRAVPLFHIGREPTASQKQEQKKKTQKLQKLQKQKKKKKKKQPHRQSSHAEVGADKPVAAPVPPQPVFRFAQPYSDQKNMQNMICEHKNMQKLKATGITNLADTAFSITSPAEARALRRALRRVDNVFTNV
jgi:hypothetical protein